MIKMIELVLVGVIYILFEALQSSRIEEFHNFL